MYVFVTPHSFDNQPSFIFVDRMTTLKDHLLNIPPVTRFFTIVTLAITVLNSLELIHSDNYFYLPNEFWGDVYYINDGDGLILKAWRLFHTLRGSYKFFTTFFIAAGEGPFIYLKIYNFYLYSSKLEGRHGKFKNNFPDYLWLIFTTGTALIVLETLIILLADSFETFLDLKYWFLPTYHRKLLACLTFLWLRHLKSTSVDFLGILRMRSYYLPLCDLALAIVESSYAVWDSLIGFFVAYLYLCFQSDTLPFYNLVPGVYGKDDPRLTYTRRLGLVSTVHDEFLPAIFDLGYLKAPRLLYKILGYPYRSSTRTTAFKRLPTPAVKGGFRSSFLNETPGETFRGSGHRLGGDSDKKNI